MFLESLLDNIVQPKTLTILPTYKCTAKCRECCFCSSPDLTDRIPKQVILKTIKSARESFPSIQLIVFSGGECFLLKDDLFECIALASELGLSTRCVTNGYWGKNYSKASEFASKLKRAGVREINISTGVEHSEWVSTDAVLNAATALVNNEILVVVTIEKDVKGSSFTRAFKSDARLKQLETKQHFILNSNSWMYFTESPLDRGNLEDRSSLEKSCSQLYSNIVVTPHRLVSSCCGLTFEYQPEMIIGDLDTENISEIYQSQKYDLLKMALSTFGPYKLCKFVYGDDDEVSTKLEKVNHLCEACLLFSREEKLNSKFLNKLNDREFVNTIVKLFVTNQNTKNSGILK